MLYWTHKDNGQVGVVDLEGNDKQTLYGSGPCGDLNAGGTDVVDIRVDAANGYVIIHCFLKKNIIVTGQEKPLCAFGPEYEYRAKH